LRKLGVSGINKGNIKEFCEAISHHAQWRIYRGAGGLQAP
jgi:hypothetical protein